MTWLKLRLPGGWGPSGLVASLGLCLLSTWGCSSDSSSPAQPSADGGSEASSGQDGSFNDGASEAQACPNGVDDAGGCKCVDSQCNAGSFCVSNSCAIPCTGHLSCAQGFECKAAQRDSDGSPVTVCVQSAFPSGPGQFLSACPNANECKTDENFYCISAGAGDADAYCSRLDCHSDSECPGGMYCGVIRIPNTVCGKPDYGDPDAGPCVEPGSFTADGGTYREGPYYLLRSICLKRSYCATCDSDLDCSRSMDTNCIKTDPSKPGYCARGCDAAVRGACPWEGASKCQAVDPARGTTCTPSYGSCVGDKSVCTPCRNDEDCWEPTSPTRKMCLRSPFSREPYCVDIDTVCHSDTDCPTSPSGLQLQCMNSSDYQGSFIYQRCYPRDNGTSSNPGHPSCWRRP